MWPEDMGSPMGLGSIRTVKLRLRVEIAPGEPEEVVGGLTGQHGALEGTFEGDSGKGLPYRARFAVLHQRYSAAGVLSVEGPEAQGAAIDPAVENRAGLGAGVEGDL